MDKEIWRDIAGYEGFYQVSNIGRVKSLERIVIDKIGRKRHLKVRFLKLQKARGYLRVNLSNGNRKEKWILVHRLVCEAFHENTQNKPEVNHINEDKLDNRACNLEWVTRKENLTHGTRPAKIAKANVKNKSKRVGQYTREGKLIKVWQSLMDVQRQLGFSSGNIGNAANGKQKTAYGYVWKYIEEGKINI